MIRARSGGTRLDSRRERRPVSPTPDAHPARDAGGRCAPGRTGSVSDVPHRSRRTTADFEDSYAGVPPWDIGMPQPAFLALAETGRLRGSVLDAGCGTGEHTLMAAERGLAATGIDAAPTAIAIAGRKAADRGLDVRLLVHDALELDQLGERFDTVLDSGLFHVFDDHDRARYVESLAAATKPGGVFHMLCFSDRQPGTWGPRRVSRGEIEHSFAGDWRIEVLEPVVFQTTMEPPEIDAWRAEIVRV